MPLNQSVWIPDLKDNFYQDSVFLQDGADLSSYVDNDTINLQQAGADFAVQKNPTYPLTATQRTDAPLSMTLDEYVVGGILVQDAETAELVYDKKMSIINNVRRRVTEEMGNIGQHAIAPTTNTSSPKTPFIKSSGAVVDGRKIVTKADMAAMAKAFDKLKLPKKGRVCLMDADAFWNFIANDTTLQQQYSYNTTNLGVVNGEFVNYYGFEIRQREGSAYYTPSNSGTTFTKMAYGAAPGVNDLSAATFYIKKESFAVAMGSIKMYEQLGNPLLQGDLLSFRWRAIIQPFRQEAIGAIVLVS
jgi:hypothetical protein